MGLVPCLNIDYLSVNACIIILFVSGIEVSASSAITKS